MDIRMTIKFKYYHNKMDFRNFISGKIKFESYWIKISHSLQLKIPKQQI